VTSHDRGPLHGRIPDDDPHDLRPHAGGPVAEVYQPVLSIRDHVPSAETAAFTRVALREIRRYIEHRHGEIEGPPFAIRHTASTSDVDLEVGWPARNLPSAGRIGAGALPSSQVRRSGHHHVAA
jgi:hypothetical protein